MAQGIVDSLFGPQPWQIQRAENKGLQDFAHQQAQMNAAQRGVQGMVTAGGMFGQAGMEGAGYVNPAMQEAQTREAVMGMGGDLSTSAGLKAKAAQFAQAGDQQTAMKLIMLAKQQEEKESEIAERDARAQYYRQGGSRGGQTSNAQLAAKQAVARNDAMKVGQNAGLAGQELMDFVDAQVQRVTDTWNQTMGTQPQGAAEVPLSQTTSVSENIKINQGQKDAMIADAQSRGDMQAVAKIEQLPVEPVGPALQSKAAVAGAVEREKVAAQQDPEVLRRAAAAKEGGKTGVDINTKYYQLAEASSRALPKVDALIEHLKTGDINTGITADLRTGVARMQALLGGKDAAKNATDTQIADVMMGSEVFPLIQSLGVGARGMDTPAERDFMRKVLTGELNLEKGTLMRMAEMRKEALDRDVQNFDRKVDAGELDEYFRNVGLPKAKFGKQPTAAKRIKFDAKGNMVK